MEKPLVLILCTGNSCRSHLAEGILRATAGDLVEVASAGSKPAGYVHPLAIQAMAEIGIDISQHRSKHLNEFLKLEQGAVSAYLGAVPLFGDRELAKAAASILGDEAMHWAILRNALGEEPVPSAYVS